MPPQDFKDSTDSTDHAKGSQIPQINPQGSDPFLDSLQQPSSSIPTVPLDGYPGVQPLYGTPPIAKHTNPYTAAPDSNYPDLSSHPPTGPTRPVSGMQNQNPGPPPGTSVPFFLDPRGPYAHIGAPHPPRRRKHKKGLVLTFIIVGVLFLFGVIFIASQGSGSDPNALFQESLSNSLATNNFTQASSDGKGVYTFKYDVADNKNPRMSGNLDITSDGTKMDGYATLQASYAKYTALGSSTTEGSSAPKALLIDKWVQIRKGGKLPTGYEPKSTPDGMFDPRTSLYGGYVFGNFAPGDQGTLVNQLQTTGVYSFDSQTVQETTIDGQAVMQYDVTTNATALTEYNKKAAALAGLTASDIDEAIAGTDFNALSKAKITWYISPENRRLIRSTVVTGSKTFTSTYSNYGATVQTTEPTPDYQYAEFQQLLTGKASTSLSGKAEDVERKADIDSIASYLETYYGTYNFYPSLANMNDSAWIQANLKGIPTATLHDPKGPNNGFAAAPSANQYSYQVYLDSSLAACDGADCQHFKVAATNSDGTVYAKESVR